jgi:ABC-type antimicrobial peptide transport system ATPase subunit
VEEPLKINTDMNAAQRQERALAIMKKVGLSRMHLPQTLSPND